MSNVKDDVIVFNTETQQQTVKQKEIFNLVPETDPILKKVMPEWDFNNPPENAQALASKLVDTCMHHRAYGLSANQCGLPYRVFVMGAGEEYVAFFNPSIVLKSKEESHMAEGCLSFPLLALNITRPAEVAVTYQDYNGEWKQSTFSGLSSHCFQHELDHLNGIVYTSRVKPMALQMGMKKRNKLQHLMQKAEKKLSKIENK